MAYTTFYVGPGGSDAANGLSWANRFLTLNGCEDEPVVARSNVYVGPGTYRETLAVDVSGGNSYTTGTISATQGDATITGSGTSWAANLLADDWFQVAVVASGTDGITDGTNAWITSAAGNFQANMDGMTIRITGKNAAILTYVSATKVTLADTAGTAVIPTAGDPLVYNVGPEPPYQIASVTDDTHLELTEPWSGPTLTGLAYETWGAINYIGDVTGAHTDGVGGVVRITGSDDDLSATRANCITQINKNYRTMRGFTVDTATGILVALVTSCSNTIIEDCSFWPTGTQQLSLGGTGTKNTVRRCIFARQTSGQTHLAILHSDTTANSAILLENCLWLIGGATAIPVSRVGGILLKNCYIKSTGGVAVSFALAAGQAITIQNSVFQGCVTAISAQAVGEILEDYNAFTGNSTARSSCTTGAHSNTYPRHWAPDMLLLGNVLPYMGYRELPISPLSAIAGFNEAGHDFYGMLRPTTSSKRSWGAVQYQPVVRNTTTKRTGASSLELTDAGRTQIFVPTTNTSTTVSIYTYRGSGYTGTLPQLIIKQPGQADRVTTDTGSAETWNELTDTFTPAAAPSYIVIELVSNNTAAAGATVYALFDDLVVS
jgi:hypothetical protein